jgi:hypothetical protein
MKLKDMRGMPRDCRIDEHREFHILSGTPLLLDEHVDVVHT